MVSSRSFVLCVLFVSLVPSLASADESLAAGVLRRVEEGLLKPLADKERSRRSFSRSKMPARERRARVTGAKTTDDLNGDAYVSFAVDVRYGAVWRENDVVGCAYPKTGALFVKRGNEFQPASVLLGADVTAAPGVCVPKAKS